MYPFGIEIVIYLFLAGIAAGAAFMATLALSSGQREPFQGGRRGITIALVFAIVGSIFLILDLTRPADFLLILTSANSTSAISWGARILVLFILADFFVWASIRNKDEIKGADHIGLWILRIAALALAIYPAFVLRQGAAFPLWQNPLIIPLIAVSAFHSGMAALLLVTSCEDCKKKARAFGLIVGLAQLILLALLANSSITWIAAITCTAIPILLAFKNSSPAARHIIALISAFAIRYWLISAGQPI
jgi:formate-dependent nitrite reductase membrane component NrfD